MITWIVECIAWVLNGLETPNIREENAGVFDNLLGNGSAS